MPCNSALGWYPNFEVFGGSESTPNAIKLYVYSVKRHFLTDSLSLTEKTNLESFQIADRIPYIYLPG